MDYGITEAVTQKLVRGAETQNVLVLHPHVLGKKSEEISQEGGVPVLHQGHQPRVPVPGREVPKLLAVKSSRD